jgi:hypothetical protein
VLDEPTHKDAEVVGKKTCCIPSFLEVLLSSNRTIRIRQMIYKLKIKKCHLSNQGSSAPYIGGESSRVKNKIQKIERKKKTEQQDL